MDIRSKLEQLETVDEYINSYQEKLRRLIKDPPEYYFLFGSTKQLEHDKVIVRKCQQYWRRKWNRIVNELPKY